MAQSKKKTPKKTKSVPSKDSAPLKKSRKGLVLLLVSLGLILIFVLVYFFLPRPTVLTALEKSVTADSQLTLEFGQFMNKKSVMKSLQVHPDLEGKWVWQGRNHLEFQPSEPLVFGETYRIDLANGAKNRYGKSILTDLSFSFSVNGEPEVLFVSPYGDTPTLEEEASLDQEEGKVLPIIDLKQPITVLFNQPMDWSSVSAGDLLVTEPRVEGEVNFLAERAFEFIPNHWPGETVINFTVPGGLVAQNGLTTTESFSWQLQTPDQRIIGVQPSPEGGVGIDQVIEVTFQLPIDLEDVLLGENVQLFPSNDLSEVDPPRSEGFFGTQMTLKPDDPLTLVFTPTPTLTLETEYELVLKAGLAGLREDYTLHFTAVEEAQLQAAERPGFELEQELVLESLPSGFAPQVKLKEGLVAPLTLQLCKLPPEANALLLPGAEPLPCTPTDVVLETVNGPQLNLGEIYPEEMWDNAVYWLKISDSQEHYQLKHLFLSDTTLIVKRAGEDLLVWALDRFTQEPVPRMEVRIYAPDGNEVGRGVTDGKGIYKRNQQLPESIYVMAIKELGGENRWSLGTDQWPMNVGSTSSAITTSPEVYLLTDRNHLEAGQTFKFQGLWRNSTQRGYTLPWQSEITLKLFDQKDQQVMTQVIQMGEKAAFNGEMTLPETLRPGLYQLKAFAVEEPLSTLSTWLKVEPQGFALNLDWSQMPDFSSKKPKGVVQLRDAQGLPGGSEVGQWQLYEHNPFNPLHTQLVESGEFEFDQNAQGHFAIEWEDENPLRPNTTYSLTAQALGQRLPVSLTHSFDYQPTDYSVELLIDDAILQENSPLKGYIIAPEDGSVASVTLMLYELGNKKPIWERLVQLPEPTQRFDYNDLILPDLKTGIYELQANSGRRVLSEAKEIYVVKEATQTIDEELSIFLNNESRPTNSKSSLLVNVPGATPQTPITVLLSYEQAGLLDYDVVVAEQPLNVIDFDVQPNMTPGVYLSALTMGQEDNPQLVVLKKELQKAYEQQEKTQEELEVAQSTEEGLGEGNIQVPTPPELEVENTEDQEIAGAPTLNPLQAKIEDLKGQIRQIQSTLATQVNATQAYLPVDETRKALGVSLNLNPTQEGEVKQSVTLQVFDEYENPAPALITVMVRPKVHFFLSPMDYFLSLPPFNVSTHSNLLLQSGEEVVSQEGQGFRNLINPFEVLPYLVFDPLLLTDEIAEVEELELDPEVELPQVGRLTYEFEFPKSDHDWEVVVLANTQENQWGSARLDLSGNELVTVEAMLPAQLSSGDQTQLRVEIQNRSNEIIESSLVVETSIFDFDTPVDVPVILQPGENKILNWSIQVKKATEAIPALHFNFNDKEYVSPVYLNDLDEKAQVKSGNFAWLHFTDLENNQAITQFEQGETYHGHLTLMSTSDYTSNPEPEEPELPLNVTVGLPAGLKMGSWLEPLNDPNWPAEQQRLAGVKGVSWVHHPLWFFEKMNLNGNRLELSAQNLPAGVYQFDFEVQAVWPGEFEMPVVRWGNGYVEVEGGGGVRVE